MIFQETYELSDFYTSLISPCGKLGLPYLNKATEPARAALPIPISVCSRTVCPNTGMVTSACSRTVCPNTGMVTSACSRTVCPNTGMVTSACSRTVCPNTGMVTSVCSRTVCPN